MHNLCPEIRSYFDWIEIIESHRPTAAAVIGYSRVLSHGVGQKVNHGQDGGGRPLSFWGILVTTYGSGPLILHGFGPLII